MRTLTWLVLGAFLAQASLYSAALHLCNDGGQSHVCADACPTEKAGADQSGSKQDQNSASSSVHHDCAHTASALLVEAQKLEQPAKQQLHSISFSDPHLYGQFEIFHPPA